MFAICLANNCLQVCLHQLVQGQSRGPNTGILGKVSKEAGGMDWVLSPLAMDGFQVKLLLALGAATLLLLI